MFIRNTEINKGKKIITCPFNVNKSYYKTVFRGENVTIEKLARKTFRRLWNRCKFLDDVFHFYSSNIFQIAI